MNMVPVGSKLQVILDPVMVPLHLVAALQTAVFSQKKNKNNKTERWLYFQEIHSCKESHSYFGFYKALLVLSL